MRQGTVMTKQKYQYNEDLTISFIYCVHLPIEHSYLWRSKKLFDQFFYSFHDSNKHLPKPIFITLTLLLEVSARHFINLIKFLDFFLSRHFENVNTWDIKNKFLEYFNLEKIVFFGATNTLSKKLHFELLNIRAQENAILGKSQSSYLKRFLIGFDFNSNRFL